MKSYTPRKKRPVKLSVETKTVRIDRNTLIEVSVSISDEEARERYYQRHTTAIRPPSLILYPVTEKECYKEPEMPIGSLERLAEIIDPDMLPEEE